ncbi:MAG: LysM peptidoglycan-binding domain-containing protein [Chloroflexota bacterium]
MRKFSLFITAIALIVTFAFSANTAHAQGGTYVVQPGDSLFSIAARFNVSISLLATVNRVYDVNSVYVGQVMTLPAQLPIGTTQTLPTGSTSGQYGIGGPIINPLPVYTTPIYTPPAVVYPGGTTVTTVTTYKSYTVRPGDFLTSIAATFNTTPQAILSANFLPNPDLLYVGQVLTIPRTTTSVFPRPIIRPVPAPSGKIYIVQPGDNLFGIAARTGRNAWSIARANGILNLNAIYVGQPLVIP